jgi:dTDP-glucose pyrophosphorylase
MKPELVVMAAGAGSRFGGLKQLEPVGPHGEVVMDYALYDAKQAGVERVVFVIRKAFAKEFHEKLGSRYSSWMEVAYAFQELDLLPQGFSRASGTVKPWGSRSSSWKA